jgi:hypothetical protein
MVEMNDMAATMEQRSAARFPRFLPLPFSPCFLTDSLRRFSRGSIMLRET